MRVDKEAGSGIIALVDRERLFCIVSSRQLSALWGGCSSAYCMCGSRLGVLQMCWLKFIKTNKVWELCTHHNTKTSPNVLIS